MSNLIRLKNTLEAQGIEFEYHENFYGVGYSDAIDARTVSLGDLCFSAEVTLDSFYSEGGEDFHKEYFAWIAEVSQQEL